MTALTTDKYTALRDYFGHSGFRDGQEELIDGILAGRDVLGVMPTGGGKSVCYQLPALMLPGLSLVISPLISLMKDQVAALEASGVPAACVNSAMSQEEFEVVRAGIKAGKYRLLYVAPERLDNEGFLALISRRQVPLVAVDEAHCISQWGQDFRPSYLRIAGFIEALDRRPVVAAFTATATERVQEDIVRKLALQDPLRMVTGFDRPNLYFSVKSPKKKLPALLELLEERRDSSGIVYCATRAAADEVWGALRQRGFPATRYHAGLPDKERRRNQEDFQYDEKPVMVATNAFGMGIDKSNVSFVIHYNMPKDLESYYQEAGRAGRDGEPADCVLLFSPGDIRTARFLIDHSGEGNEEVSDAERQTRRKSDLERLKTMVNYCKTAGCLRGYILGYFGQPHQERCGNCGGCREPKQETDITVDAQKILSCVIRVQKKLGYYVGRTLIVQVLRGNRNQRVVSLGLDGLTTFGLMKDKEPRGIQNQIDCLEEKGYLHTEPEHQTLRDTPRAKAVLFRGEKVTMLIPVSDRPEEAASERREPRTEPDRGERKGRRKRDVGSGMSPSISTISAPAPDEGLLAALREKRTQLAREEQVPAYIVFSNATLADMAAKRPRTMEEFKKVVGVGAVKAERYGTAFLKVIAWYCWEEEQRRGI